MDKYDYLVVGSGLFGATFAHLKKKEGKRCLVIDKRHHLGGNVYTENIEGINVHKYGPHTFHTSNKKTWDFVNSIVEFNHFITTTVANYKGTIYNLPFNMNTFSKMWGITTPEEARIIIEEQKQEALAAMKLAGVEEPRNLEEQALLLIGKDIYEKLIKGYTEKQWGRKCSELPPFIIKRLPVRFVYNNNYFNDIYQGVPKGGYTKLIMGMLDGIDTRVESDYFKNREYWNNLANKIVFTGPIDEYFGFRFGKLEYRTVNFVEEILDMPNYQGNAVVNFTERDVPYTRIIEHKHYEFFGEEIYKLPRTVVTKEYSTEWSEGMEPYYPVNNEKNNILYQKYRELANQEKNVLFGGRLAEYRYYDMAPVIERSFELAAIF